MKVKGSISKIKVLDYNGILLDHLKVDEGTDTALIEAYIAAAGEHIERYLGYPLLSDTITIVNTANGNTIELIKGVLTEDVTIEQRQDDGTWEEVTLTGTTYDDYGMRVILTSDDLINGNEYRLTCSNAGVIPANVRHAALLLVAEMYEQRENRVNNSVMRHRVNSILDMETLPI